MTPLFALHGFTGSPESWDFVPGTAAPRRLAPALVGHAGCAADEAVLGFESEVDRLAALMPSEEPLHVIGYSLGARLALGIALRHPSRVRRLTLLSAHPGLSSDAERAARRQSDAVWCDLLLSNGIAAFVDAWQAQPLWATQAHLPPATTERKRSERLRHSGLGLARSLRLTGLAEMPNYTPLLPDLRIPVAIVAGGLDLKFSELARLMAERVPHAELEIAPGAGHDLLLERPEFITDLIRRGNQT